MQVNAYRPNQNQVSFSSTKISRTVVRDMNDMPVKAWFSRLNFSDPVDKEAMEKAKVQWKRQQEWNYANDIYDEFKIGQPVYAIELDSANGSLSDRLLCLASTHLKNDTFKLYFLQASPNSSFKALKEERKYKGAGTALMYGLVKIAELEKAKMFKLRSDTDDFYRILGMVERNLHMTFNQHEMNDFLKRQESEFDLLLQKQPKKTEEMALKCS